MTRTKKKSKREIYAAHGIEFARIDGQEKINAPFLGWISPLLINGNEKLGKDVWTFSMLPSNLVFTVAIGGQVMEIRGTCPCNCPGCYAQAGNYNFPSCVEALARRTYLAYHFLKWVEAAIIAQIEADKIKYCRIHAAGDFFNVEYIQTWRNICIACLGCQFWTYTKNKAAENAFDDLDNINIVKSIIPGVGVNYGTCAYILEAYARLTAAGIPVYICRCGMDDKQHCNTCDGCRKYGHVLFIQHSTPGYNAKKDPLFPVLCKVIESQGK